MIIGADGASTHPRFMRLSSLDSVNRRPYEHLMKQHYKPVLVHGEPVSVCTRIDGLVHFDR